VGVAAHQLTGVARAWWDGYYDAHDDPRSISWEEFTEAFREHHVPEGVMDAKVEEFRNFTQGTLKVQEYTTRFIRMMWYAPEETSSDKKMYHYKKGLNSRLKIALSGHECHTLWQMINKVLEMERARLEADAQRERKEKRRRGKGSSRTLAQRQCGSAPP
jgi:hypothetical protein